MAEPCFVIKQDAKGEYRWNFRGTNGELVADCAEGYVSKADCERGIEIVKTEAPTAAVEEG